MSYCIDKEQVVAGFINTQKDKTEFNLDDIYDYARMLFNAGVGPIRLNFTRPEMKTYLSLCEGICLHKTATGYKIDKSLLSSYMTPAENKFLHNNKELARSFDLFCKLHVDLRTPKLLLDAMGYHFVYA